MQIDSSEQHPENANPSIDESFDPHSNVTVMRERQSLKQLSPSFSTEAGMQIDESDEHDKNESPSMSESRDPDSNVTFDKLLQQPKQ
jgi:hypothetical protein